MLKYDWTQEKQQVWRMEEKEIRKLFVTDIIPLVQWIPYQGFGDFKIGGQVIRTTKYADDLVLPAKVETILQGMTDRPNESEDAL